jgi:hypothetical protein
MAHGRLSLNHRDRGTMSVIEVAGRGPGPQAPDLMRRRLLVAAPLAWTAGCASTRVTPVPSGESVDIVYADGLAVDQVPIDNLALASNTRTGAGTGAALGALSGLGCGPLAFLCVPMGLLMGGLTGGIGGAAVGLTGSLSKDKMLALRNRLIAVHATTPLLPELRAQIDLRAARVWELKSRASTHRLHVDITALELTSTRSEDIGMTLTASTRLEKLGSSGGPSPAGAKAFSAMAPPAPLGVWLDDRNDFVESVFRTGAQQLAAQIVAEYSHS